MTDVIPSKDVSVLPCPFCAAAAREFMWPKHYGCSDEKCGAHAANLTAEQWNRRAPVETSTTHEHRWVLPAPPVTASNYFCGDCGFFPGPEISAPSVAGASRTVLSQESAGRAAVGADSPPETKADPAAVLAWAVRSFGSIALNRDERAARMAEEAVEVAQVEGVPLEVMQRITARVYSRPVGELGQEIGGLVLGLYALAANAGIDIDAEFMREFRRVLSKPADWWARKHAEKVAAGTADLTPVKQQSVARTIPTATFPWS